jgi:hypothetical protein
MPSASQILIVIDAAPGAGQILIGKDVSSSQCCNPKVKIMKILVKTRPMQMFKKNSKFQCFMFRQYSFISIFKHFF